MHLIFIVAFLILEIIAAIGIPAGRFSIMAAGLACYAASLIF